MRNLILLLVFLISEPVNLVAQNTFRIKDYTLSAPSASFILPDILSEISGISAIDSITIACVQDEMGVVFVYDTRKRQLIKQVQFAGRGDYEGIAMVNRTVYILRSDGLLYEVSDYLAKLPEVKIHETGIPAGNNEGLCFDRAKKRLLIACKDNYPDDDYKNRIIIFAFDLTLKKLSPEPVVSIDIKLLRKAVKEYKIKFPGVDSDEIDGMDFNVSEIAINPVSNRIYLLSASDFALLVCDLTGRIEIIEPLKNELFRQAEGLTFSVKGDLFVSNEAAGKSPVLLRFNYRKNPSIVTTR